MRLYNSFTRKTETFEPHDPQRVTIYACGPTVYDYVHIGNARGPVVLDILVKTLMRKYGEENILYARNITDVDDKINQRAMEQYVPIAAITEKFAHIYQHDMLRLEVKPPHIEPKVTENIPAIIDMVQRLVASGHAYQAEGHVLFSVASFSEYGRLSGRDPEELRAGGRVDPAPYKRDQGDFVLWKPSSDDLPGWSSPWGRGRPGWHIECSAMIGKHLGETIDIHAGGLDLQFPHHENEMAQSHCAHQKPLARWWFHNGMLNFEGGKMSKSIGNVMRLHHLLEKFPPEALRLALLSAHYRQPLEWSEDLIHQSVKTLDRLYGTLRDIEHIEASPSIPKDVEEALHDDLNTPRVLSLVSKLASNIRKIKAEGKEDDVRLKELKSALLGSGLVLGLIQKSPLEWFTRLQGSENMPSQESEDKKRIDALVRERQEAKEQRDFARADDLRLLLQEEGVIVEDTPQGARWRSM